MPNWCSNNLSIYGKKEDMEPFMNKIKNEDGSYSLLEKLYPTPEELLIGDVSMTPDDKQIENEKKYGYRSWYEWRIANWGVKWPENELTEGQQYTEYDSGNAVIAFNFESPWCSPLEAFDKISADYPKLLFCIYYEEPGMGFCGKAVWGNGEKQESVEAELVQDYFDEEYLYEEYVANA